jgi:chaperonin GroES
MDDFPIEPLGDRLIVKQVEANDVSPGGIIIPQAAKEPPKEAIVRAVGPGKRLESGEILPVLVDPGDRVVFASYAGQEITVDDETYILLSHDDILARVRA